MSLTDFIARDNNNPHISGVRRNDTLFINPILFSVMSGAGYYYHTFIYILKLSVTQSFHLL